MTRSHVLSIAAIALLVPAAGARAAAPPPPELPEPTFKSVSKEVLIPMDDGVKLAATIALPVARTAQTPLPGRFPVVVGHDAVQPQRRLRLLRRRTSSRRAGWSAPSSTCAARAAAAATSRATTSRRARRATATTSIEYLGTQP